MGSTEISRVESTSEVDKTTLNDRPAMSVEDAPSPRASSPRASFLEENLNCVDQGDVGLMSIHTFWKYLKVNRVCLDEYGIGWAKTYRDLWVEVVLGESKLIKSPLLKPRLRRTVRSIELELCTKIRGQHAFLLVKDEVLSSGASRLGLMLPPSMKRYHDETPDAALSRFFVGSLNLPANFCEENFSIMDCSGIKEIKMSTSYPTLLTHYTIHLYSIYIPEKIHGDLGCLGLPDGDDSETIVRGTLDNSSTTVFTWVASSEFKECMLRCHDRQTKRRYTSWKNIFKSRSSRGSDVPSLTPLYGTYLPVDHEWIEWDALSTLSSLSSSSRSPKF